MADDAAARHSSADVKRLDLHDYGDRTTPRILLRAKGVSRFSTFTQNHSWKAVQVTLS